MVDHFGSCVAISGDAAIVGARLHDHNGTKSGAAYVYRFNGTVWVQEAKLLPLDGYASQFFGCSVSICGDTAVVGASGDDDNGTDAGAVYVFRFDGEEWVQEEKITVSSGGTRDEFGRSVAVEENSIVAGATRHGDPFGSAYVFRFDGAKWRVQGVLEPVDSRIGNLFGWSVSISGGFAVVGAQGDDNENGINAGSAYVFSFDGTDWVQQSKLIASDGVLEDHFGYSVAISGNTAVIGSPFHNTDGNEGAAYVFRFDGTNWAPVTRLIPASEIGGIRYGWSVSISGNTAVIGAPWYNADGTIGQSGAAYAFHFDGSSWTADGKLLAADGEAGDHFGFAVAASDGIALVGAQFDDDRGTDSGSAYIFNTACDSCPVDLNDDGVVNTLDVLVFLNAWVADDVVADWNGDMTIDIRDFLAYLNDWVAGC